MKCIPLEQLIQDWERDAVIDTIDPQKAMIRIPVLHAKYVSQITAHTVALKMKRFDYAELKKLKLQYYGTNGLSQELLKEKGWKPNPLLILKHDMPTYLDADKDLIALSKGMLNNEEAISFCTAVGKELNSRTFQIREYMAWEKFIRGQN